ncbi:hypothetical protein ACFVQB_12450 [Paenibacillus sp. NPDC057886]|uniref:hypothetical protein n=1 Tax=Paenibacillus sp. NPDC057886 TaxID=3346270 RepID=UPI003686EDA1
MADIIKLLYQAVLPTSATSVYTAPQGKYTVIKSIFLSSLANGTDRTFRMIIGGITVGYDHVVKSFKTLLLNDLNIFLLPGESIQLHCPGGNMISQISGIEVDYIASEFPYIKSNGVLSVPSSAILNPDASNDRLIKSLIITNPSSTSTEVVVQANGFALMYRQLIKPYDTLVVPMPNFFLIKGQTITANVISGSGTLFGIVAKKVVQ